MQTLEEELAKPRDYCFVTVLYKTHIKLNSHEDVSENSYWVKSLLYNNSVRFLM